MSEPGPAPAPVETVVDAIAALEDQATEQQVLSAIATAIERDLPVDESLVRRYPQYRAAMVARFGDAEWLQTAPSETRPLAAGETFDGYELIERLGQGGMGVVFRAREAGSDRVVALKTLRDRFADEDDRRRFDLESRATAQLEHPGIVPVYRVRVVAGTPYFTMKLVEGGSLTEHAEALRGDLRRAVALMSQVARAIHFAHDHAILHRDLKPDNILLDGDQPLVTDFGLACAIGDASGQTISGAVLGTAPYMAPEQAEGRRHDICVTTDVYGLGAVLYHLLTGAPPFKGERLLETLRMVGQEHARCPRERNPAVDADLSAVVLRCLEKRPADRYDSADDLADDLDRWLAGEPVLARPVSRIVRGWRWVRRNPHRAAMAALVGVLPALLVLAASWQLDAMGRKHAEALARKDSILQSDRFCARLAARVLSTQLTRIGEPVRRAGERLASAIGEGDDVTAALGAVVPRGGVPGLDGVPYLSWFVLDREGALVARWPVAKAIGEDFSARDYFRGALETEGAYVSRVYRAKADALDKFGVSVALRHRGEVVGVLVASVGTDDSLGLPMIHDPVRTVSLVAHVDPSSGEGLRLVVHPSFGGSSGGQAVPVDPAPFANVGLSRGVEGYRDPLGSGLTLAGIAPVEGAPFFVVVEQPFDAHRTAAAELDAVRGRWRVTLILLGGGVLVLALMLWPRRRPRPVVQ